MNYDILKTQDKDNQNIKDGYNALTEWQKETITKIVVAYFLGDSDTPKEQKEKTQLWIYEAQKAVVFYEAKTSGAFGIDTDDLLCSYYNAERLSDLLHELSRILE
jgi:hypothetical protein